MTSRPLDNRFVGLLKPEDECDIIPSKNDLNPPRKLAFPVSVNESPKA